MISPTTFQQVSFPFLLLLMGQTLIVMTSLRAFQLNFSLSFLLFMSLPTIITTFQQAYQQVTFQSLLLRSVVSLEAEVVHVHFSRVEVAECLASLLVLQYFVTRLEVV